MSMTIINPQTGLPTEVFVRAVDGGYIDAICRAETQAAWEAAAEANHLTVDGVPIDGANINVIGPVVVTPAILDAQGNTLVPPVLDERYHVNLRLRDDLNWQAVALAWMAYGVPDPDQNAAEVAQELSQVSLIDPDTISSPSQVWL